MESSSEAAAALRLAVRGSMRAGAPEDSTRPVMYAVRGPAPSPPPRQAEWRPAARAAVGAASLSAAQPPPGPLLRATAGPAATADGKGREDAMSFALGVLQRAQSQRGASGSTGTGTARRTAQQMRPSEPRSSVSGGSSADPELQQWLAAANLQAQVDLLRSCGVVTVAQVTAAGGVPMECLRAMPAGVPERLQRAVNRHQRQSALPLAVGQYTRTLPPECDFQGRFLRDCLCLQRRRCRCSR